MNATTNVQLKIWDTSNSTRNQQSSEKCVSKRIHNTTPFLCNYWATNACSFDYVGIIAELALDAATTREAVVRGATDKENTPLSTRQVSDELEILADDLRNIITATEDFIAAGRFPLNHPRTGESIEYFNNFLAEQVTLLREHQNWMAARATLADR